ncbi:MAG: glucose-6-phosphate dehydrogenase [Planctomycetes bacterium]|nr:glucose-6-phosphate dehydrogenase [Planctomycetota bacterium]
MPHSIVIFGASGDLTSRKLIPALYLLHRKRRLPEETVVVGVSRSDYGHEQWRSMLAETTARFVGEEFNPQTWTEFAQSVYYVPGDVNQVDDVRRLATVLPDLEPGQPCARLYYLSMAPSLYETAILHLGAAGLAEESPGERRIVIEKPFGVNRETARRLNEVVHRAFHERQVYRIDHYLGKETVQNILVLRFANSIFEPIWNRNYVDHVQITVAEEVAVGKRGDYYDQSGVLRDMFQNHLLQLMMITAMEAPVRFEADLVRDEKVKVLRAVRTMRGADFARDTIRGQYLGYRNEKGVPADSQTATFAALKLAIDNWRWQGVPFYLRSGKAMSCRTTQIVIQFREPPHMLFSGPKRTRFDANRLVIQVQPAEGLQLHFQTKVPDAGMQLRLTDLDFRFQEKFAGALPDAYQRLLLDALTGDASLFARSDEVELAWGVIDPILAAWQSPAAPPLEHYEIGQWGPESSTGWMRDQGREWFDVCPVLKSQSL